MPLDGALCRRDVTRVGLRLAAGVAAWSGCSSGGDRRSDSCLPCGTIGQIRAVPGGPGLNHMPDGAPQLSPPRYLPGGSLRGLAAILENIVPFRAIWPIKFMMS
jgi:hypothetical protein